MYLSPGSTPFFFACQEGNLDVVRLPAFLKDEETFWQFRKRFREEMIIRDASRDPDVTMCSIDEVRVQWLF